jgi:AP2 domain
MTPPLEEAYLKLVDRSIAHPSEYANCPICGRIMAVRSKRCMYCRRTFIPTIEQPADPSYRLIPLMNTQEVAIVATEKYAQISASRWSAMWGPAGNCWYAIRYERPPNSKRILIMMHREVMGLTPDDPRTVDHAFHNTLDNRQFIDGKENLRFATMTEQNCNHRMNKRNTSGYKGVSWEKTNSKWRAYINVHKKRYHLGYFDTPELAYAAYCEAALKLHGKFACLG